MPPLSSLKYAICGSSDMSVELLEDIKQWMGIEVYEGYGLTEGGPVVLESRKGLHKPGSAGFPLPGCSIRIVNATEEDVLEGMIGELWVSNPGVADGYWNLPTAPDRLLEGNDIGLLVAAILSLSPQAVVEELTVRPMRVTLFS